MTTLRTAVIGVGAIGSLHARIYARDPRCELVAVVDAQRERAETLARELGCAVYSDAAALVAAEKLDLVSIATPEQQRYEPALTCARAGVHLLLEKPLAGRIEETDRLIEAVEATGVRATVNFILRSDIRYQAAQAQVANGTLGEVCTIFARRRGTSVGAEIYGPWTDLLISTAIHDIDAMAWINGSPIERVYAEGVVKRCAQWGHEDAVVATLRFANGAVGTLETSWVMPPTLPPGLDAAFQLAATGGAVEIAGSNYGLSVLTAEGYRLPDLGNWPMLRSGIGGALQANLAAVVDGLISGDALPISLREARRAHAVVAALKQSLSEERPIRLPLSA
jgi:predicted dehydrogenase